MVVVLVHCFSELVLSIEAIEVEVKPVIPNSLSYVSSVTCWLCLPKVALPLILWSLPLPATCATLPRFAADAARIPPSSCVAATTALQDPTGVWPPTMHDPIPDLGTGSIAWVLCSLVVLEQGTNASTAMPLEAAVAAAMAAARCGSSHGTNMFP
ncbi:hypothetical protein MtrunA17_Chr7g0231471 [Medicago truncatula]|uniref:Transmembrane protein n=1 Tax=Medicago truncatula TaxID=3880 RepID=A0A396GZ08_MEDTR|nr:hypothetical protein MtrunA17_Chr7g0231471 [Medicago truncatula]